MYAHLKDPVVHVYVYELQPSITVCEKSLTTWLKTRVVTTHSRD